MPFSLNHITVFVKDVEKSILFYEKLGLNLIVKSLPKYARFECKRGDATFSLHKIEEGKEIYCSSFIYFETGNLDREVLELQKQGIIFDELPEDKNWLWREAKIRDPDGNHLILYYAGENRKNPPWRIS